MATAKAANKGNRKDSNSKPNNSKGAKTMKTNNSKVDEINKDKDETVLIPQDMIDAVTDKLKQLEVNTLDMQKLGFALGHDLNRIKALFKEATKQFGPVMTTRFPALDTDYRGSYMYMATNEKGIKAWLKATGKGSKLSSCRSIQRQYAASLKTPKDDDDDDKEPKTITRSVGQLIAEIQLLSEKVIKKLDGKTLASEHVETINSVKKTLDSLTK